MQAKVFQFKLVLLGESAVGKSSLVLRFVKGQFLEYQESTIGGMNKNKQMDPKSQMRRKKIFLSELLKFKKTSIFVFNCSERKKGDFEP